MRRLDEVTHPQPVADFIQIAFDHFRGRHPWVGGDLVRPKSVAREMVEEYLGFGEYVRRYGLQRSEGVLLRYLSQAYKTLDQNVPDTLKSDAVWDIIGYLRAVLERTDTCSSRSGVADPSRAQIPGRVEPGGHRRLVANELLADPRRLT
jgi:hypothetical protein